MAQRFKVKKLNKDDHKDVKKAADNTKKGLALFSVAVAAIPVIKGGIKFAKNIILKKYLIN